GIDVDIYKASVGGEIDGRRYHTDAAFVLTAIDTGHGNHLPHFQLWQHRFRYFAAPLDTVLAQETQHLGARLRDLTHADGTCSNHAIIRSSHLGVLQTQTRRFEIGLGCFDAA